MAYTLGLGPGSPPALCCKVGVPEEALRSRDLEAPRPAGDHLGAFGGGGGESVWARTSRVGYRPGLRSRQAPHLKARGPGFDLKQTAWLGNFLRVLFLYPRVAWSAGEPRAAGAAARPQEGAPARGCGCGSGPSFGVALLQRGRGGAAGVVLHKLLRFRSPQVTSSTIQEMMTQGGLCRPRLLFIPPLIPTFLVISQLLSARPPTAREHEANQSYLKLTKCGLVWQH